MLDDVRAGLADVDDDAAFLVPGASFGRYTLVRRLAIGGMAEIHLARAGGISGFEKLVVLKRILPQFAASDDFVEMFLDEARLGASLDHANIVQVYDVAQVGRSYFMAMEYLQGQDVRNIQAAARKHARLLTIGEALSIAIPTSAGLHYAHEKCGSDGRPLGVVHRDVSPANVVVTRDGCVKLVDFGIARSTLRNTQTRAGTLKGKISYMSPEQCRGESIDRRSDVFAFGIVMYELMTGLRPFNGDNEYAILSQIIAGVVPPPSIKNPEFPAELERILLKALRPRPMDRYQSARELQIELEAYARTERLETGPVVLARMLEELAFTYRTDVRAQLPPSGPALPLPMLGVGIDCAEAAPLDDELAYSMVIDAASATGFDDGPSAQLDNELLAAQVSASGSAPRRAAPRAQPAAAAPAGVLTRLAPHHKLRWFAGGAALLVAIGVGIGALLGGGGGGPAALPTPSAASLAMPAALPAAQLNAPVLTPAPRPETVESEPTTDAKAALAAIAGPPPDAVAKTAAGVAAKPAPAVATKRGPAPAAKPGVATKKPTVITKPPAVITKPPAPAAKPRKPAPATRPAAKPAAKPAAPWKGGWDPDSPLPPPR